MHACIQTTSMFRLDVSAIVLLQPPGGWRIFMVNICAWLCRFWSYPGAIKGLPGANLRFCARYFRPWWSGSIWDIRKISIDCKLMEFFKHTVYFRVWGSLHLLFAVRAPKKGCDYFWPLHCLENMFLPFSYMGGLLVHLWKWKNWIVLTFMCCRASSSCLNHKTLESKQNYPQHTKTVQKSTLFYARSESITYTVWWFSVVRLLKAPESCQNIIFSHFVKNIINFKYHSYVASLYGV